MDWIFYLVVLVVLFSIIAILGIFRYLMHVRLKRIERRLKMENEAQQTAESNSGL